MNDTLFSAVFGAGLCLLLVGQPGPGALVFQLVSTEGC
jgi:hypothetical protein